MFRQVTESVIICIGFLAGAGLIDALGKPAQMTFAKVNTDLPMGHEYMAKSQSPFPASPPSKQTKPVVATKPKETKPSPLKEAQIAFEKDEEEDHKDDGRIFNNRMKVLWLCLGALGGAWCFFAYNLIKTLNFVATSMRLKTTCYITVAFISALFATPWTLIHFQIQTSEETCAFAGWLASIVSWGGIEVLTILLRKLGFAAEQGGIGGVTKFMAGGTINGGNVTDSGASDDKKQPTPGS